MPRPRRPARPLPLLAALALLAACGGSPAVGDGPDDPIAAPAEQWSWVPFPSSACANGTPTGLGINPTARSTDLVVYLEGGGACWDELTCFALGSAVNLNGYGEAAFAADATRAAAPFDRADPLNPLRDASFVLVPYCTGDLHAGRIVRTYRPGGVATPLHHVGRHNLDAFLRRLAPTFPGARRVYLAGSSAGGYGAQLLYEVVAAAFPAAEVHLLADGAQLVQPAAGRLAAWLASWQPELPAGCADCASSLPALAAWLPAAHPDRRFGLLADTDDGTLTLFFGFPLDGSFGAATRGLLASPGLQVANARHFARAGASHTMLGGLDTIVGPGGVALRDWVRWWYQGDPAWGDVGP